MNRREFITFLGGAAVAWPFATLAQKSAKVPRVGYLGYSAAGLEQHLLTTFEKGLADVGYVEGKNLAIEYRSEGKLERLPELAAQLIALNVDVIVTLATPGALAAKNATNTIPLLRPFAQRYSIATFSDSTYPASFKPWRNARKRSAYKSGASLPRNPTTGSADCCARAASGQAAAPPSRLMNALLLTRSPRRRWRTRRREW